MVTPTPLPVTLAAMPNRLRPTNPTAAAAILVGDPGRALFLAQELLVNPLMSNHARGLWGYSAATAEGLPLTIQATGMGGPSAAIVFSDLVRLGLRQAVRIGTCESLDPGLQRGDLVLVEAATGSAGAGPERSAPELIEPRGTISAKLADTDLPFATVRSSDIGTSVRWATGASNPAPVPGRRTVHDLQTATLFSLAARLEIDIAAILVVEGPAEDFHSAIDQRSGPEDLEAAVRRAGEIAVGALTKAQPED